MTLVAYLSHPIGEADTIDEIVARQDNLRNAGEWLDFLVAYAGWAVLCPWLAYTDTRKLHGPRTLAHQILLLERCDVMVQVGVYHSNQLSPHMTHELRHATRQNMPVIDMMRFGLRPPTGPTELDEAERELREAVKRHMRTQRRRVWLPPLGDGEIDKLRAAQRRLAEDPESAEASEIVQRIVSAAIMNPR